MTTKTIKAPAKVNLTLHVTGVQQNGYHLLDSLVVFADACDIISASPAPDLRLTVSGPFSSGVPSDDRNLILRAAAALRRIRNVTAGAHLTLEKQLPHAAGIGSGSSDAAQTLKLLADMWHVAPLPATAPEIGLLGSDISVCMNAPSPIRMGGTGEVLSPVTALPDCALVLVNPRISLPTRDVFLALDDKNNAMMTPLPERLDYDGFVKWLLVQRNDLQGPAERLAPQVATALKRLRAIPAVNWAGMSGSGATCIGLVRDMAAARHVARVIQVAEMGWWVTPAEVLKPASTSGAAT